MRGDREADFVRVRRHKVVPQRINDQHDRPLELARQRAVWEFGGSIVLRCNIQCKC